MSSVVEARAGSVGAGWIVLAVVVLAIALPLLRLVISEYFTP